MVGTQLDCTHDRIREVLRAALVPPVYKALHLCGRARRSNRSTPTICGRIMGPLAIHFWEGEDWPAAAQRFEEAGPPRSLERRDARRRAAFSASALDALARLPETRERMEQTIEIHFALRDALMPVGNLSEARRHSRRGRYPQPSVSVTSAVAAMSRPIMADYAASSSRRGASGVLLARPHWRGAEEFDDARLRRLTYVLLAAAYHDLGDYRRAIATTNASLDQASGDLFSDLMATASTAISALPRCFMQLGEWAEARSALRDAREWALREGSPHALVRTIYYRRGYRDERLSAQDRAIPTLEQGPGDRARA